LLGSFPLLPHPLLVKEELEEVVCDCRRREGPRSIKARAVAMAATKGMSTRESNNFLVVEAIMA